MARSPRQEFSGALSDVTSEKVPERLLINQLPIPRSSPFCIS